MGTDQDVTDAPKLEGGYKMGEAKEQRNRVCVLTLNPLPNHHFLSLLPLIYMESLLPCEGAHVIKRVQKIWWSFPNNACVVLSLFYDYLVPETNLEVFRMCSKLFSTIIF